MRPSFYTVVTTLAVVSSLAGAIGCGKTDGTAGSIVRTYGSTSTAGDFATWTIDTSADPDTFDVAWSVTNSSGAVTETITANGTCGIPDATYAFRICTIASSSRAGLAGQQFHWLELPGVALLVHPISSGGRSSSGDEIHVGFAIGSCNDSVTGDYTFMHTAPGGSSGTYEAFGVYRVNDPNFGSVTHADFGLRIASSTSFDMAYTAGSPGGVETFSSHSCTNGVRTLVLSGTTMRGILTQSGMFFLDLPRGDGGIISFRGDSAATIDDFASKSLVVLTFGDGDCSSSSGDCVDLLRVNLGAKDGQGRVPVTGGSILDGGTFPGGSNLIAISNSSVAGSRFSTLSAGSSGFSSNALSSTYSDPSTVPGIFYTDETSSGVETPTIMIATKFGGKLVFVGSKMKKSGSPPTCVSGSTCYHVGGQFIGFEP